MKEKFYRFMQGRYGTYGQDELSKFMSGASWVYIILYLLTKNVIFYLLILGNLIYLLYRTFSKNYSARYNENQKFVGFKNQWKHRWENHKRLREQKKIYRIYSCPYCKQKIRIPKGKGTIIVTCPKCKKEFGKRS